MTARQEPLRPEVRGVSLVAGEERPGDGPPFVAIDPTTEAALDPTFRPAAAADIDDAVEAADRAFRSAELHPWLTVGLLNTTADLLEEAADTVISVCDSETALGQPRLRSELARTSGQLRFLADVAASGERLDAAIDGPRPAATPPAPDVRRVGLPIGPVAVFGASNFPLAFGVLGGDTSSALAAGCPVVAKAHPAHPGTSELCGRILTEAVARHGLDPGWFSLVQGAGPEVGQRLVGASGVRAVGFTGSSQAGQALVDVARQRAQPIPVYAEMGSVNPTFVSARAIRRRGQALAAELVEAITMGSGQFCTKPGLVFVPDGPEGDELAAAMATELGERPATPLLTPAIRDALQQRVGAVSRVPEVGIIGVQPEPEGTGLRAPGSLLSTDLDALRGAPQLVDELFGPAAVVVRCPEDEMVRAADVVDGSLTGSVYLEPEDRGWGRALLVELQRRCGRIIVDGVPTGVRVSRAMHHGGPFPATSTPLHTSVGAASLDRWLRPVSYQNTPNELLPPALQDENPLGILRRVDGVLTEAPLPSADETGS